MLKAETELSLILPSRLITIYTKLLTVSQQSRLLRTRASELQQSGLLRTVRTDGLTGFTEALKEAFPKTTHQHCLIHPIRNSWKYVAVKDQKEFLIDLKKI